MATHPPQRRFSVAGDIGHKLRERGDGRERKALQRLRTGRFGDDRPAEAKLLRFLQPCGRLRHWPDRARKRYFTEIDRIGGKRRTRKRRYQRSGRGDIGGRLGDPKPACHIEINVVAGKPNAAMGFQHRQHHRQAG